MTVVAKVGVVSITTLDGRAPTQIRTAQDKWEYYRKEDDFSSGDVVYKDGEGDWHLLECGNCGIEPMEGDNKFICPECNAIFR